MGAAPRGLPLPCRSEQEGETSTLSSGIRAVFGALACPLKALVTGKTSPPWASPSDRRPGPELGDQFWSKPFKLRKALRYTEPHEKWGVGQSLNQAKQL